MLCAPLAQGRQEPCPASMQAATRICMPCPPPPHTPRTPPPCFAERHACAELQEAYAEHQKRLVGEARSRVAQAKADVHEQFAAYTASQDRMAAAAAAAAAAAGGGGGDGGEGSGPRAGGRRGA